MLKEKSDFGRKYNMENNIKLIEILEKLDISENKNLISLDIKDMFTNITVNKVINLIENNKTGITNTKNN